jgi:hypothetical protein
MLQNTHIFVIVYFWIIHHLNEKNNTKKFMPTPSKCNEAFNESFQNIFILLSSPLYYIFYIYFSPLTPRAALLLITFFCSLAGVCFCTAWIFYEKQKHIFSCSSIFYLFIIVFVVGQLQMDDWKNENLIILKKNWKTIFKWLKVVKNELGSFVF